MATDAVSNDLPEALPVAPQPAVDHLVTEDDAPVDNFFFAEQLRQLGVEPAG